MTATAAKPQSATYHRVMLKISGEALMGDQGYRPAPADRATHRRRGEIRA